MKLDNLTLYTWMNEELRKRKREMKGDGEKHHEKL
jgi:hypothetical protein